MAENRPEPGPYFGREAIMREFEQLRQRGTPTPLTEVLHRR